MLFCAIIMLLLIWLETAVRMTSEHDQLGYLPFVFANLAVARFVIINFSIDYLFCTKFSIYDVKSILKLEKSKRLLICYIYNN